MKKIKVQKTVDGCHHLGLYNIVDVTDETYRIIERMVIENSTNNTELQCYVLEKSELLEMLMGTSITREIYNAALTEGIENIKNKKI